jgi:hypothetical protein
MSAKYSPGSTSGMAVAAYVGPVPLSEVDVWNGAVGKTGISCRIRQQNCHAEQQRSRD